MLAYCLKCKTKREIKDPNNITMKNKRSAVQGVCRVCGTKMFKILKKQLIETEPTTNPQLARQPLIVELAPQPPTLRLEP